MCLASKYLGEMDSLVTKMKNDLDKLHKKQSEYDKKLSDVYHDIEVDNFNACEGYYHAKKLKELLQKRRLIKTELYRIQSMYDLLKIGNKVRNIHNNTEGTLVYSSFGASISGITYDENGNKVHFQTLGKPIREYESDWKRVYKFKFNMKEVNYENKKN